MDEECMVPPANEEERALFGEILPLPQPQSRKARSRRAADTVDIVAAGKEQFVTLVEVAKNSEASFKYTAPVLRTPRVSFNTRRIMSGLNRKVQALSVDVQEAIKEQYLDNLKLDKKYFVKNRDILSSCTVNCSLCIKESPTSESRFSGTSQPLSMQTFRILPASTCSTQSSLSSFILPAISSWSLSNDSLSSLTACSSGIDDFLESFAVEKDNSPASYECDLSLTPPPSTREKESFPRERLRPMLSRKAKHKN